MPAPPCVLSRYSGACRRQPSGERRAVLGWPLVAACWGCPLRNVAGVAVVLAAVFLPLVVSAQNLVYLPAITRAGPSGQPTATATPTTPSSHNRIAFSEPIGHIYDIYTIASDGSGRAKLTSFPYSASSLDGNCCPKWSPDGERIGFMSGLNSPHLFTMAADGSNQVDLLNGTGILATADGASFVWSPDSSHIAFTSSGSSGGVSSAEIYTVDAWSGQLKPLTDNQVYDGMPSWSPDGRKIAFTSARGGMNGISVMNADGTGVELLSGGVTWHDSFPRWSPDGLHIAFISIRLGDDGRGGAWPPDALRDERRRHRPEGLGRSGVWESSMVSGREPAGLQQRRVGRREQRPLPLYH